MLGVNQRLLELNQERDIIIKLAKSNDSSAKSNDIIKHVKEKKTKKHWTQTRKGRERMRQLMLDMYKRKRAKNG